jgi:hypothetical protein
VAGFLGLLMALIVPFYVGVLAAVLGAYLTALLIRRRRIPWQETGLALLTGVLPLGPVAYNAWVFSANPAFRIWAAQNLILSPHPVHYLLGYALLLPPAIWGAVKARRSGDERRLLPVAWVLVAPVLLYLPFNLQRRMIALVQVPLALLAAQGLRIWFGDGEGKGRRWAQVAYVAVAGLSNVLLVAGSLGPIGHREPPIFRPGAEVAALDWLAEHSTRDQIVLSSVEVGNYVPARTDLRVFAGHGPETLHFEEKEEAVHRFFQADAEDAWRLSLLGEYGIAYVFYGPQEGALGDWNPSTANYLTPIYDQAGYTLFQVTGEGQP